MSVSQVDKILSILTLLGHAGIILLLVKRYVPLKKFLSIPFTIGSSQKLRIAFIVSLIATIGSLYYSEVARYAPCTLCWYQRIFMYPQVLLLGWGILKTSLSNVRPYSMMLAVLGFVIALFHVIEQRTQSPLSPCSLVGYSSSCSESFVQTFGYITIPVMSLTAFALIIILLSTDQFELRGFGRAS